MIAGSLETFNMARRFVVATTHHLLVIEPETDRLWLLHSGTGMYFGLARGPDGLLYAACRNTTTYGPETDDVRAAEQGSILVFDEKLNLRGDLRPPDFRLRHLHGMACFDGQLWITCTYDNMVAIFDLASRTWRQWYPSPNVTERGRDVHHFNAICFTGGQVCVLAHKFGASEVLFYEYPSLRLDSVISLGIMSHNLFFFNDSLATCSSGEGCIVNRSGQRLRTGGFPRGMGTTSEGNLLGISMLCPRDQRQLQDGILRWFGADWRFRTDYIMPQVGMVLDVIDIGEPESAWDLLKPWPHAETTHGSYNRIAPGNLYVPDSFASPRGSADWHGPETAHRWTAARETALTVLINPGETHLQAEVSSWNPQPYYVELWLDEQHLGTLRFPIPGNQRRQFRLPANSAGQHLLTFRVPDLWKPSDVTPGSNDNRLLGVAVNGVRID